jgi:hypothetical protein
MSGVGISFDGSHLFGCGRIESFPETVTATSKGLLITAMKRFMP